MRHDELIADCVADARGPVRGVDGRGRLRPSRFSTPPRARSPAALAPRVRSPRSSGPATCASRARFGLHTGEAERRGTGYVGPVDQPRRPAARPGRRRPDLALLGDRRPRRAGTCPPAARWSISARIVLRGVAAPERIHALKAPGCRHRWPRPSALTAGCSPSRPRTATCSSAAKRSSPSSSGELAPGRLLAVVGASGSGKSSVLRAGIIAAALAGEIPGIRTARLLTPGARPAVRHRRATPHELIVVDQFEELFTLCDDADRRLGVHRRAAVDPRRGRARDAGRHVRTASALIRSSPARSPPTSSCSGR